MQQENKNKKDKQRILIIIIVLLLLFVIAISLILLRNNVSFVKTYSDVAESDKQVQINLQERKKQNEEEYTEIVGYGEIHLYQDYPYVYLINPEDNTVYMQFDIFNNDKLLYSSALIAPGMMESFDAYKALDAGSHTLKYEISTYDMKTKELLMTGINQNQDVFIEK